MRFLVVHGDEAGGKALGRTLENLGHQVLVVAYVGEVPESAGVDAIDAVLVGIETPSISGIELAHEMAVRAPRLPIGFLATSGTDPLLIDAAARVGPVLPEPWAEAHVRAVIDVFERWHARLPTVTPSSPPEAPTEPMPEATPVPDGPRRRVHVSCPSRDRLVQLCSGGARITVRAREGLRLGELVKISLDLTGASLASQISIDGQVDGVVGESASIRLVGMSEHRTAELLAMWRGQSSQ